MKIALIRTLSGLKPAYDSDNESLKKIKLNQIYEFEFKQPRNYKHHRKFFALINLAFQNQDVYSNIDDLREDLTVSSGYYRMIQDRQGNEIKKPLSISFASMDQSEFNELYSKVCRVIIEWLGVTNTEIEEEITQYY
jgi:hypothetical protein